ncbi:CAP domain-containing protein [Flavihumibacter petaseus]|uniref:SCP domain-containing protein n=1 Tax=Flavihumibacter petaseus NBRC 106054 TaxID=1220578 RepID=A0A0E9N3V5_9BACT|nr:CAP domain-containing protein [Flavihumibacter petaseus]GAO44463.1 hypothetical protein FPE01S_03_05000 [Flavihumibacter petaseus NBRC 106054]
MRCMLFIVPVAMVMMACHSKPPAKSSGSTSAPKKTSTYSLSNLEVDIVTEVNKYRKSIGLPALESSSVVATEAAVHSQRMASGQTPFGHEGFSARLSRINSRLGETSASGENVAYGKMSAHDVVQFWLKSAPHKKNIEGKYNLTGIGISRDSKGNVYYTQIFILK